MKVPKKIAKFVKTYEEINKMLLRLQEEAEVCKKVFTDWERENIDSGVCIKDLHIVEKPRGEAEGKGEYRECFQHEDTLSGTYFLPIKGSDKYVAYDYSIGDFKNLKNGEEKKMSETKQTITLELTKGEVLMLQELTSDMEHSYPWMASIAESLRQKALAAYKKPYMDASEYADMVDSARKLWRGEAVQDEMILAKQRELEFFNDVEEINY